MQSLFLDCHSNICKTHFTNARTHKYTRYLSFFFLYIWKKQKIRDTVHLHTKKHPGTYIHFYRCLFCLCAVKYDRRYQFNTLKWKILCFSKVPDLLNDINYTIDELLFRNGMKRSEIWPWSAWLRIRLLCEPRTQ